MKIASVTGYRYRLPLTASLQLGTREVTVREGILVRITVTDGTEGWGDVAPLPGFSTESLAAAQDALYAAAALRGQPVQAALARVAEEVHASSVRFGLEQALFDVRAQAAGTTLPHVLCEAPRSVVSLNALVTGSGDAALDEADRLRAAGYRAVKLKVGRQSVADDVALVRRVKDRLGGVALRLDANRAWSLDEAHAFADGVADVPIEYVEEPLADVAALPDFAAVAGLPVALDETVQEGGSPAAHPYARAIVIKPTLVGGLVRAQQMARQAVESGATPVVSAAFESGVGLRGLVALSACLGPADVPVGLDTYRWFVADVLHPRLQIDRPQVEVEPMMATERRLVSDVLQSEQSLIS